MKKHSSRSIILLQKIKKTFDFAPLIVRKTSFERHFQEQISPCVLKCFLILNFIKNIKWYCHVKSDDARNGYD